MIQLDYSLHEFRLLTKTMRYECWGILIASNEISLRVLFCN